MAFQVQSISQFTSAQMMVLIAVVFIIVGVVWLLIEGHFVRKNYERENPKRVTRVTIATIIAVVGIVMMTIAGIMAHL